MGKEKAVEGLIIPNKWDDKGKIIGIAIHTDKEEIYLVAHNRIEGELLNNLHIKVEMQGKNHGTFGWQQIYTCQKL